MFFFFQGTEQSFLHLHSIMSDSESGAHIEAEGTALKTVLKNMCSVYPMKSLQISTVPTGWESQEKHVISGMLY